MEDLPILTGEQMRFADRFTIQELGLPSLVLMEVAGRAVAAAVQQERQGAPVLVLAGTGNNGADGVVAARHLRERGVPVEVLVFGPQSKLSADAKTQVQVYRRLGGTVDFETGGAALASLCRRMDRHPILVDALFGTGLDRSVQGFRAQAMERARVRGLPSVAVDLPSGLQADTGAALAPVIPARRTVTFQFLKPALVTEPGRTLAGQVDVADIGIPPRVLSRIRPVARTAGPPPLPPRGADSHKGTHGHLLAVGGAPDRPGSILLAARAALRMGAGLVTVATDAETLGRLAGQLGPVMGTSVGRAGVHARTLESALEDKRAWLVGPSLPGDGRTAHWLLPLLHKVDKPVVLDAGALRALRLEDLRDRAGPTILTPHPGELAGLLRSSTAEIQADRWSAAREAASRSQAVVVLKGAGTVVADPAGRLSVVLRGNPGLGTGGSGDVLGGMVAGYGMEQADPFRAAVGAAWLHGAAADRWAERGGQRSLTAADLLDALPGVLAHGESSWNPEPGGPGGP